MNIFTTISKRKRIESMVKSAIDDAAVDGDHGSRSGVCILQIVSSFVELWPAKYFDIADDRKVAGLVLAYMMEISELEIEDVNSCGYTL